MTTRYFPTSCAAPVPAPEEPVRTVPLVVAGLLAVGLTWFVWASYGAKQGVLLVLGLALGLALFHSRFGFTSAWRQLIAVGNGEGLRAHTLLLGTAATLIALIISTGYGPVRLGPQGRRQPAWDWRCWWVRCCSRSACSSAARARPARCSRSVPASPRSC